MRKEILDKIEKSYKTGKIHLENLNIGDHEILEIVEKIKKLQPHLTVLNLDGNNLGNTAALILKQHLNDFKDLKELGLQFNHVGKEGVGFLFGLERKKNKKLTILLHGNLEIGGVDQLREIEKKTHEEQTNSYRSY